MADQLTRVDDLTRSDHWHLRAEDECAFCGEYYAGRGYQHSPTNQLIFNLKKSPLRRGKPEYHYKTEAINKAANMLRSGMRDGALDDCTFVPVPPSKARDDPEYDDRMVQVARAIVQGSRGNVREIIAQTASYESSHASPARMRPSDLERLYVVDEAQCNSIRAMFIVLDDTLTTGAHFVAMKSVLNMRFPGHPIFGLFVARRVPTDAAPEPDPPPFGLVDP